MALKSFPVGTAYCRETDGYRLGRDNGLPVGTISLKHQNYACKLNAAGTQNVYRQLIFSIYDI